MKLAGYYATRQKLINEYVRKAEDQVQRKLTPGEEKKVRQLAVLHVEYELDKVYTPYQKNIEFWKPVGIAGFCVIFITIYAANHTPQDLSTVDMCSPYNMIETIPLEYRDGSFSKGYYLPDSWGGCKGNTR